MTIEKKVVYTCNKCGKKYAIPPKQCDCEKERIIGWAKLLSDRDSKNIVKVQCLICCSERDIAYYNIRRQKSCGCVPRSIEVVEVSEFEVRYRCRRCGDISIESLPCEPSCECANG